MSTFLSQFSRSSEFLYNYAEPFPVHLQITWERGMILSLTVSKRKNRCIPCAYLGTAIFIVVIEYCNLFPSFTLFLNCFHFTFGYELIVCSKSTSFMKIICNGLAFICRNKSLFLNLDKIYCFQGI